MASTLKRTLGLPMLTFYGIGMILGAGIYSIIGKAAGIAGESLWQGFLLAAIAALLTALSYAELATMYPKAGAEYFYLKNAFAKKKWIATAVGLLVFFAGASTAATVSLAFAGYLQHFVGLSAFLVAALILIIFSGVNMIGVQASGWFNIAFTLIEVGGLILLIILGMASDKFLNALMVLPHSATLTSSALIIFAYFGFENIANLSEEAKNPERTVPLAILLSILISTVLYVLVSLAAVALLSPNELANSNAPLVDAVATRSRLATSIMGASALFSTANTTLIALVTTSRILFGIANDGALFKLLSKTSTKRKTPWVAALAALTVALCLLPLGAVDVVASVSSFVTLMAFIAVNVALIVLRQREPKLKRVFRVPLTIGTWPILPMAGAVLCIVFLFQFSMQVTLIGCGCLVLAISFALIQKRISKT